MSDEGRNTQARVRGALGSVAAAFALVVALAACGGGGGAQEGDASGNGGAGEGAEESPAQGPEKDGSADGDEDDEDDELSCAGDPDLPEGIDPRVCDPDPEDAGELSPDEHGLAGVASPTENIICGVRDEDVYCSMAEPSLVQVMLGTSGEAYTPDRQDAPVGSSLETLEYGEAGVLGPFACLSQEIGMSCWNTETRHGLFLSQESTLQW